jgi:hypothetical protein
MVSKDDIVEARKAELFLRAEVSESFADALDRILAHVEAGPRTEDGVWVKEGDIVWRDGEECEVTTYGISDEPGDLQDAAYPIGRCRSTPETEREAAEKEDGDGLS